MPAYMGEEEVIQKNMALAQEKTYTVDFMEALPEDVRAELIDGQLFYMAAPTSTHQALLAFLFAAIWNHIQSRQGRCKVYPAPLAVYLNKDNRTYLEPDIILVCDPDKIVEKGCMGAPDFVAEIVSPSTQSRDYLLKLNKYQDAGVSEYWILDTNRDTIHVYDFASDRKYTFGFNDKVALRVLEGLEVDFSQFPL